jgi:hypothetical protein
VLDIDPVVNAASETAFPIQLALGCADGRLRNDAINAICRRGRESKRRY